MAVYIRALGSIADGYQLGTNQTADDGYAYLSVRSAHLYAAADGTGTQDALDVATAFAPGFYQLVKENNTLTMYRNGTALSATPASLTEIISTYPIYLGALNDHNAFTINYSDSEMAFASVGPAMSGAQAATYYTKVQAIQTAFGRAL